MKYRGLTPGGKYPAFLKMRVAQEDLEIIEEKAALLKITKSEFVRRAIRNSHVYILPSKEIKEFTSELRHIGVNVNQIAILCNMGKLECVNLEETKEAITKAWKELYKLREAIRNKNNRGGLSFEKRI